MTYIFQPKRLLCCTKLRSLGKSEKTWIRSGKKKNDGKKKLAKQIKKTHKKITITTTTATHNTILSDKRIIGSTEIDKPVPIAAPQQHCDGVKGSRQHCRPSVSHQITFSDHPNITHLTVHRILRHEPRHLLPLRRRSGGVEVEEVVIGRVVECPQRPLQPAAVAGGGGDEVGEGDGVFWGTERFDCGLERGG